MRQFTIDSHLPGPTLAIISGLHGDETPGIHAVQEFLKNAKPQSGKLILIPILNENGFQQKRRCYTNPESTELIDLNHIMPGENKNTSTQAQKLAHTIFETVKQADYIVDVHSARVGQKNYPHIRANIDHEATKKLAMSQNLPIVHWPATPTTLRGALYNIDKPCIVVEAGEALTQDYTKELVNMLTILVQNLTSSKTNTQPEIYDTHEWVESISTEKPLITPGEYVLNNQPLTKMQTAKKEGLVIGVYNNPQPKSRLCHLAIKQKR